MLKNILQRVKDFFAVIFFLFIGVTLPLWMALLVVIWFPFGLIGALFTEEEPVDKLMPIP